MVMPVSLSGSPPDPPSPASAPSPPASGAAATPAPAPTDVRAWLSTRPQATSKLWNMTADNRGAPRNIVLSLGCGPLARQREHLRSRARQVLPEPRGRDRAHAAAR